MTHHRLLVFIWFDAADKEGITLTQRLHQGLQGLFELRGKCGGSLPCLGSHVKILTEKVLQELVLGDVNQLQQVSTECVSVLLQKVPGVVEDDAGKVVEAEGGVDVRLGLQVVAVVAVPLVQLVEQCLTERLSN